MIEAPIFKAFRKWIAGKTFIIVLVAIGAGGLWYMTHSIGAARAENTLLQEQVEVLTRARAADKLALDARDAGRVEAAAEYEEGQEMLSDGAQASPEWAAEELPAAIREALR